jgi:hypothetical protein
MEVSEIVDEYEGFYNVTGYVTGCKWPLVLKSAKGFHFASDEPINGLPVASYELREARA